MSQATTKRLEDEKAQLEREVALLKSSPAPQGWEKDYSRKQKKVWYSNATATTRHTQWHAPTVLEYLIKSSEFVISGKLHFFFSLLFGSCDHITRTAPVSPPPPTLQVASRPSPPAPALCDYRYPSTISKRATLGVADDGAGRLTLLSSPVVAVSSSATL
jgi:hypothetical protein